jgi:hypothetical protein
MLCPPEKPTRIRAREIPQVKPGEAPPAAVGKYVQALSDHLQKKHPEAFDRSLVIGQTLIAYLVLQHFETSDPGVIAGRNLTRAFIHRLTRRNDITESDLHVRYEQMTELKFDEAMEKFRDLCCYLLEEGEYAPQPAGPEVAAGQRSRVTLPALDPGQDFEDRVRHGPVDPVLEDRFRG